MRLCYNQTYFIEQERDAIFTANDTQEHLREIKGECEIVRITSEDVEDAKFQWSRVLLGLGCVFGIFFTLVLSLAVFWNSINLTPVGAGLLMTYFLVSFSMLFFDTNLCVQHKCRVGTGCVFAIAASLSWVAAYLTSAKMDAFKIHAERKRQFTEHRYARRAKRKAAEELQKYHRRESSSSTSKTIGSSE